jgi:hypothetical protein
MKTIRRNHAQLFLILGVFLIFLLAGCFTAPERTAFPPEPSSTPEPTSTATIQWFPPTPTPTIVPTRGTTPTPNQHPGLGEVILSDDFTDKTLWDIGQREAGSVAYSQQKLTLAISQASGVLYSFRKTPSLGDFYLTLQVNPVLCRQADVYALLFRVNSAVDFYRLLINCKGLMRLERIRNSEITILQDWLSSGQIAPGAPLNLQIGVWAVASDLRVFVEDVYQFGVKDSTFLQGWLGVYARSMGANAVTVNFSDLIVRSVHP